MEDTLKKDLDLWGNYDFTDNSYTNTSEMMYGGMNAFNARIYSKAFAFASVAAYDTSTTDEKMRNQWIDYGNSFLSAIKKPWSSKIDFGEDGFNLFSKDSLTAVLETSGRSYDTMKTIIGSVGNGIGLAASQAFAKIANNANDVLASFENWISTNYGDDGVMIAEQVADGMDTISDTLGGDSTIATVIKNSIGIFSQSLKQYKNGVDETSFGRLMESSWNKGGNNSFVALAGTTGGFYFSDVSPIDPGSDMSSIYGNMLLGVPPLFSHIADPRNRTLTNIFLKDARFITLTPGFAKYNGSNLLLSENNNQYNQTKDPKSMLEYLKRNGLDSTYATKDRRYYTFENDFAEYYSYLETMLNTIWVKMGLGTNNSMTSLFTFFDNPTSTDAKLKSQYTTGLGFYISDPHITEDVSSNKTSYGQSYSSTVNSNSETYQQINYLTGMGTGGSVRNASAITAKSLGMITNMKAFTSDILSNTISNLTSKKASNLLRLPVDIANDIRHFTTEVDPGAILQSFSTTNGMNVVYPELWSDSTFTKSMNFDFEFISPYGDPLSIFQYVIVPFCALACFAMPRQAADNGYVSPFFIRANIPGMFNCDFGLITDFNWTRGGRNNLWTKDGLPRAISCSIVIDDLYPYLAMTKRISFLSANPNYTSWLDSLSGLHSVSIDNSEDPLNDHWRAMLNYATGTNITTGLTNTYNQASQTSHSTYTTTARKNLMYSKTKALSNISWLRES